MRRVSERAEARAVPAAEIPQQNPRASPGDRQARSALAPTAACSQRRIPVSKKTRGGSRQPELFGRSMSPVIPIEENHRLVQLADKLDWTELELRAKEHPGQQVEERRWAAATAPRAPGRDGVCDPVHALPSAGRPDSALRASAVPVRADGDGLDSGPQYAPRLHGVDGGRGSPLHQRVRGGRGGGGKAGRPEGVGGGHDGARGGHPASERDGVDGWVPDDHRRREHAGRWSLQGVCPGGGPAARSREEDSARVPARSSEPG